MDKLVTIAGYQFQSVVYLAYQNNPFGPFLFD